MFFLTILTILSSYILYKTIQGVFFILCDNMVSLDGSISINLNQSINLSISKSHGFLFTDCQQFLFLCLHCTFNC